MGDPNESGNRTPPDLRRARLVRTTDPRGIPAVQVTESGEIVVSVPERPRKDTDEQIAAAVADARAAERAAVTDEHRLAAVEARQSASSKWVGTAVTLALGAALAVAKTLYGRGADDGAMHERIDRVIRDVERMSHDLDDIRLRELRRSSVPSPAPSTVTTSRIP